MAEERVALYEIAYARSGDKGGDANIGLIAYTPCGYQVLREEVSAELVAGHFAALSPKKVVRYELPNLLALNFLLYGVLEGGGSSCLRIDSQGKALGQALLELSISVPCYLLSNCLKRGR